ncbi:hypothetical protein AgCh_025566 [Apium graveolens]
MCQGAESVKKTMVHTLRIEFESMCMKGSEQLDHLYLRLNGLVTNIRALSEEMKEAYVMKKLLRAMPTKLLQIVSTLEHLRNLETLYVEEVVGYLKAHEEGIKGGENGESNKEQLILTEEEWQKYESSDGKLLLTREHWLKINNRINTYNSSSSFINRGGRDKSDLNCYNCSPYGHFAADCHKPRRTRDLKEVIKWPRPMKMRNRLFSWKSPERKVRVVITDRGGEFRSKEFKKFYEKDRIKRYYTAPYTPQQNVVVERRNRIVMEMAKICLKEMKLPSFMWGEAVRHSVYLLNKFSKRALLGITPYEAWDEKKPQARHIRVFGCISYMRIPSLKMSKLDDRSKPVVNLAESPKLQSPVQQLNPGNYDDSAELKGIINLSEIDNETEEQQLDKKLYLMGIEEPMNFVQAAKDINWKLAMKKEM